MFSNCWNRILNRYSELRAEIKQTPAYQIEEIKLVNNSYLLSVQIVGTGKNITYPLNQIVLDDSLLKQFPIIDIRAIIKLHCTQLLQPEFSIISQKYSAVGNTVFCLKSKETGKIHELTASEIFVNKNILHQCSPEAAYRIGFIYASENSEKDLVH
jgi:hypothetical protein